MGSDQVPDGPRDALARAIFHRWRSAATDLDAAGVSVPGATAGIATGRSGEAVYRLTLTDAARIAVDVAPPMVWAVVFDQGQPADIIEVYSNEDAARQYADTLGGSRSGYQVEQRPVLPNWIEPGAAQ